MRPLANTRVVSMAVNVPGPVAAARLRGLGALVVKVEPPSGDPLASICPDWYADLTRGMEVVSWDLRDDAGAAAMREVLASADLFLTASLPDSLTRLGLDWDTLHAAYPRLCQAAITGYPPPRDNEPGHDLTFQAGLGLLEPECMPKLLVADMAGAERAAAAALALLLERERTGQGHFAAIPLGEAGREFAQPFIQGLTRRGSVLGGGLASYGIYPARDGFVALAALEGHFLARLGKLLDVDPTRAEELAGRFRERSAEEWSQWARENRIPLAALAEA